MKTGGLFMSKAQASKLIKNIGVGVALLALLTTAGCTGTVVKPG